MVQKHRLNNYLVSLSAAMCMILCGYDGSLYSSVQVMGSWLDKFGNPDPSMLGMVSTAYMIGILVCGYFIAPFFSDWLGRRWAIMIGATIVVIGALIMSFAPNIAAFIAGRVIVGGGTGITLPSGPLMIGELCYADIRGRLMSFWQMFWSVGAIIAAYIALGTTYSSGLGDWQWRMVVFMQIVPAGVLILVVYLSPETPRWYIQNDREDDARASLMRVRLPEEVDEELFEIREAIRFERMNTKHPYRQLFFTKSYRHRLILAVLLNFCQQINGQGTFVQYTGIIYQEVFNSSKVIILINAINWITSLLFCLPATFLSDRWGRKPLLMLSSLGQGCALLGASTLVTQSPTGPNGSKSVGVGVGTVLFLFTYNFFYQPGWGAQTWLWTSEVFPMVVRAKGLAIGSMTQNLANIVLGQGFPPFLEKCGFYAFYMFTGINFALIFMIWTLYPETKGIKLENMDALFGGVNHVTAGATLDGMQDRMEEKVDVVRAEVA